MSRKTKIILLGLIPLILVNLPGIYHRYSWKIPGPSSQAVVATFVDAAIEFSIERIATSTHPKTLLRMKTANDGQTVALSGGNPNFFYLSLDTGKTWKKTAPLILSGHSDFLVTDNNKITTVSATLADNKSNTPAKLILRTFDQPSGTAIYSAAVKDKSSAEQLRDVRIVESGKNAYIFFNSMVPGQAQKLHTIRYSPLTGETNDSGLVAKVNNPYAALSDYTALSTNNDTLLVAYVEWKLPVEERLKRRKATWWTRFIPNYFHDLTNRRVSITSSKNHGKNWSWRDDGPRVKNLSGIYRAYTPSKIDLLELEETPAMIWRQAYSKSKMKGFGAFETESVEDILFATPKNGNWTSPPMRINDHQELKIEQHSLQNPARPTDKGLRFETATSPNGQNIAVLFRDYRLGKGTLFLTFSTDSGKTWAKNISLFPEYSTDISAFDVEISNSGAIHAFFKDPTTGAIYHASGNT